MRQSPPISISIVSDVVGVGDAPPSFSGSGVIVTGTSPDVDGGAASGFSANPYRRRQLKTWFALTLCWRATTETDAPGTNVAATISRFSASGQRLFRRRP